VVEEGRPYRKGWLVRFEGVEDRTEAELLLGRYVLVPSAELGGLEEGEVFYHQLLGLEVETVAGEVVGRVREVYETEPDHMLEVKGEGRVHLIPFARRIVRMLDVEAGRLVIDPPEGLLEL
jgi:16S rRNA processing protein RimM